MADTLNYHLLSDLVSALETDGFEIGTGKHLQVQELLRKLPDDIPLEELKTLLSPVFCTNRQEQERFYELFEQSLNRILRIAQAPAEEVIEPVDPVARNTMRWRNVLLGLIVLFSGWAGYILEFNLFNWTQNPTLLLLALLIGGGIYFSYVTLSKWRHRIAYLALLALVAMAAHFLKPLTLPKLQVTTASIYLSITAPGAKVTERIPLEKDSLLSVSFCDGSRAGADSLLGTYQIDSLGYFTYTANETLVDTTALPLCVLAVYRNFVDTTFFVVQFRPQSIAPPTPVASKLLDTIQLPLLDLAALQIDLAAQTKAAFYKENAWWIKLLLIVLLAAIFWSIVQWRERKRLQLIAQLEQRDKPPYIWNIKADQAEALFFGEEVRILLQQLRRRLLDDFYKLDIPQTVHATVKSAGRVDFKFKQQTIPPEYLILIDRQAYGDHRAQLYDHLFQAFKANEINVERFFYQKDVRLCFNEAFPNGISIKELQHKYGDTRLLIFGNGFDILSPMSGKLSKWATIFSGWRERALFSPQPLATWGKREEGLSEMFFVMPASVESLAATLEQFSSIERRSPDELIGKMEDLVWRPIELEGDLISSLQKYYTEPMLRWIAACALYPSLHWDLTLFLGRELSTDEENLLTVECLFELTRLPWFVDGHIPNQARVELIEYLSKNGLEIPLRQRIQQLFDSIAKPSTDSVAFDEYKLNAVGNELLHTKDRRRRRALEQEMGRYLIAGHEPDVVVLRYLNKPRSPLDFAVPDSWKKYVFHSGYSFFGWKDWLWASPLWTFLTLGILFYTPNVEGICEGKQVQYNSMQLCLDSAADYLTYYEQLIREAIVKEDTAEVDSLWNRARAYFTETLVDSLATSSSTVIGTMKQVAVDTVPFYRNLSTAYYNIGVKYHNQWQNLNDSITTILDAEETTPQQQESTAENEARMARYQSWRVMADSFAMRSCSYFRSGSRLFTSVTGGVGYNFFLAMQKICPETPTTPAIPNEDFVGIVTDARSNRPIANVSVKALNGAVVALSDKAGRYTLSLPENMVGTVLKINYTAKGYVEETQDLNIQQPLLTVSLEPLQREEKVEIYTAKSGMMGLRSSLGKEITPARYNRIDLDPSTGWYRVQIISKLDIQMGYLDSQGNVVIPLDYRALGFLRDGLIAASSEKSGYLDRNGNIAIAFQYESVRDFRNGEAEVSQRLEGQLFTFIINKDGRCIRNCPPTERTVKEKGTVETVNENIDCSPILLYFDWDRPREKEGNDLKAVVQQYAQRIKVVSDSIDRQNQNKDKKSSRIIKNTPQVFLKNQYDDFVERELLSGFNDFKSCLDRFYTYLQAGQQVEITLRSFSSSDFNQRLLDRRMNLVERYILQNSKAPLDAYLKSGQLRIIKVSDGSAPQQQVQQNAPLAQDNATYDPAAMLNRRLEVEMRLLQQKRG